MRRLIKKTLKLRRNINYAVCEIHERHGSVCTDSMSGTPPLQYRLTGFSASMVNRDFVVNLQWERRPHWSVIIDGRAFQVHENASHKYWLRGLIRRCR